MSASGSKAYAGGHIGGHTQTIDVNYARRAYAVDTGFIVYNDWTYPNFVKLMDELPVPWQPSPMSFSVRCEKTGLEYNGTNIEFFANHGFLSVNDHPTWRVISGGSKQYVRRLTASYAGRIHLNTPVAALLHTDEHLMPRRPLAWAAWNYHLPIEQYDRVTVTYNMNILQSLAAPVQFLLTLNRSAAVDPAKVLGSYVYHHPVYTTAAVAAQKRRHEIDGSRRTYYCGAYWGYGFHEDGANPQPLSLSDVHALSRSRRTAATLRRHAVLVRPTPYCRVVQTQRLSGAGGPSARCRGTQPG